MPHQTVALRIVLEHTTRTVTLALADVLPIEPRTWDIDEYVRATTVLGEALDANMDGVEIAVLTLALSHPIVGVQIRSSFSVAVRRFSTVCMTVMLSEAGVGLSVGDGFVTFGAEAFARPGVVSGSLGDWDAVVAPLH